MLDANMLNICYRHSAGTMKPSLVIGMVNCFLWHQFEMGL